MMRQKKTKLTCVAVVTLAFGISSAFALDLNITANSASSNIMHNNGAVNPELLFFKSGITAYKQGDKEKAIEALRSAADMGHMGACWKLAHIYAEGDGVVVNDYKAYQFYVKILQNGAEPGSENESYVSDALVEIASYLKKGIPNSPLKADIVRARQFYMQAAINFGNPEAQYHLGKMFFDGEGGKKDLVQAARWFQLSARKGNVGSQAMLGNMLFQAGKTVQGLAMMTAAYEKAKPEERQWIRPLQERAFAIALEAERRTAVSLANEILKGDGL